MKNIIALLFLLFGSSLFSFAQEEQPDYIKPRERKQIFFGVSSGLNAITSLNEKNEYGYQGGLLAEYSWRRKRAIGIGARYYHAALNPYGGTLYRFDADVINFPVSYISRMLISQKWDMEVRYGVSFVQEIKSVYRFNPSQSTNFDPLYITVNFGAGVNYMFRNKHHFSLLAEVFYGGQKSAYESNLATPPTMCNLNISLVYKRAIFDF